MQFSRLAHYLENLEKTSSRLEITDFLAKLFTKSSPSELDKICYLLLGKLAPKYVGWEFFLAEKMMVRAIAQATNQKVDEVSKDYKNSGDLGETIYKYKIKQLKTDGFNQKNSRLSVNDVYDQLQLISFESGQGSQERKLTRMANLLREIDALSAKYIVRIPVKKLRLGFSDMTILDALSWMKTGDKSLRPELERAFNVLADIGRIARIFGEKGIKGIKKIEPEVGVPIRAAKATPLSSPEEILAKMNGKTALEPKYDGFRVQIHMDKFKTQKPNSKSQNLNLFEKLEGKPKEIFVKIFSRNLDDMTNMFPEIVSAVQKLPVDSVILDGEAIAVDLVTGKFLPFQQTVKRKRKHGIDKKAQEIPLKVFIFDCLYFNGQPFLSRPFIKRRRILQKLLAKKKKTLLLTQQKQIASVKGFKQFFQETVTEGLEGLMAKKLDAGYQAGARNFVWIKYKAGMQSELADTVDCVVMGYYKGRGKRNKFGIGAFLVGVLNSKNNFMSVSKIGTGLTDKQWREMRSRCQKLKVKAKPIEFKVDKNLKPDIWCRPRLVVEIEADTITRSPIHTAGLALRFPRLKRFRDDKEAVEATTAKELARLAKV